MSFGIVAGIAGPLIGAIISGNAADDAAQAQVTAANNNNATQLEIFNRQVELQKPFREAGIAALNQEVAGVAPGGEFSTAFGEKPPQPADIANDPGYKFRMDEGMKALERSAAARGGLLSGGTLKGLTRYAQGNASSEFQNAYSRYNASFDRFQADRTARFNRLASLSGGGQTASNQLQGAATNYGNALVQSNNDTARSLAGASVAQGNAWNGALGSIGSNLSKLFGNDSNSGS